MIEALSCPGPLIWFSVGIPEEDAAILECAKCGFIIATGWFMDRKHRSTPMLREGIFNG